MSANLQAEEVGIPTGNAHRDLDASFDQLCPRPRFQRDNPRFSTMCKRKLEVSGLQPMSEHIMMDSKRGKPMRTCVAEVAWRSLNIRLDIRMAGPCGAASWVPKDKGLVQLVEDVASKVRGLNGAGGAQKPGRNAEPLANLLLPPHIRVTVRESRCCPSHQHVPGQTLTLLAVAISNLESHVTPTLLGSSISDTSIRRYSLI